MQEHADAHEKAPENRLNEKPPARGHDRTSVNDAADLDIN
jgi:hypothetical protein